jgi:hypothetical protein
MIKVKKKRHQEGFLDWAPWYTPVIPVLRRLRKEPSQSGYTKKKKKERKIPK